MLSELREEPRCFSLRGEDAEGEWGSNRSLSRSGDRILICDARERLGPRVGWGCAWKPPRPRTTDWVCVYGGVLILEVDQMPVSLTVWSLVPVDRG